MVVLDELDAQQGLLAVEVEVEVALAGLLDAQQVLTPVLVVVVFVFVCFVQAGLDEEEQHEDEKEQEEP